jgi:hypothetical protein
MGSTSRWYVTAWLVLEAPSDALDEQPRASAALSTSTHAPRARFESNLEPRMFAISRYKVPKATRWVNATAQIQYSR